MWEVEQVQSRKLYEAVVDKIKEMIIKEELKAGEKLPSVRLLSESFNVSQSTIREALSVLNTIGLVRTRQGDGTYVQDVNNTLPEYLLVPKSDIIDLLEVRKMLERGSVILAAQKRTAEDLQKIEQAIKQMKEGSAEDSFGEVADWTFHFAIAEASQNKILISLMKQLSSTMISALKASRSKISSSEEKITRIYEEHFGIYEAIRDQDVKLAEERMLAHLVGVQEYIVRIDFP